MTPEALAALHRLYAGEPSPPPRWHGWAAWSVLIVALVLLVVAPLALVAATAVGSIGLVRSPELREWLGLDRPPADPDDVCPRCHGRGTP